MTNAGKPPDAELVRRIAADEIPDVVSPDAPLAPTYLDDRLFASMTGLSGWLARHLPYRAAQVVEVYLRAPSYDLVVAWSDVPAILIAATLRLVPRRPALVAIVMWPSKPKKAIPLRLVQGGIDRFVHFAPLQRAFLEERLHIAPERILDGRSRVDTRFWRPMSVAGDDSICAVGQEMRDYATLVEALRDTDIPCHIAVGSSFLGLSDRKWWRHSLDQSAVPANITVGRRNFAELRELYASSRFVVIPLIPSANSNGLTAILEAFAMGKAVVVTDSPGQVGILQEGVNSLRVPPRDPAALREAIERLWRDPELCARMGAAGRALVSAEYNLDQWTSTLSRAAIEAIEARDRRQSR
ncbi:MAG TPA: glycosyltransferase family 4 protein [Solirubrobacteraceae bacterium]|nr:glycosyltransferase family 4 protein [Solirubrobacteraceae bacterium]